MLSRILFLATTNLQFDFVPVPTINKYLREHATSVHYYGQYPGAETSYFRQLVEIEAQCQRTNGELNQNHHPELPVYHSGESAIYYHSFHSFVIYTEFLYYHHYKSHYVYVQFDGLLTHPLII